MSVVIRKATETDQDAIQTLVRTERLNPNGLHWPRFIVAVSDGVMVGAVQLRRHTDGSRELGSLVVTKKFRGAGLAAQMIDHLLASENGPVSMITGRDFAAHYRRWGFEPTSALLAPKCIRRNYLIGQSISAIYALLNRRKIKRLAVLRRPSPQISNARENPIAQRLRA